MPSCKPILWWAVVPLERRTNAGESMQLKRYNMFVNEVAKRRATRAEIVNVSFSRFFKGEWFDEKDEKISEIEEFQNVQKARNQEKTIRAIRSKIAHFYMKEFDSVVSIECQAPPKAGTQARISQFLSECAEGAIFEFKATHHDLTGLKNRDAFSRLLREVISESARGDIENAKSQIDVSAPIALIALDIDNFKQVNDTHGHLYGDVVLRALALRLENISSKLQEQMGVSIVPAHPSGEEFLVLISNAATQSVERQIAEEIRSDVESRPLPDEAEWQTIQLTGAVEGVTLPSVAERRVTVSIGFTTLRQAVAPEEIDAVCSRLKRQADAALYRAKASGRNVCVNFSEILSKFGRVLEFHPENSIVCIDIGRNVGVKTGQEFLIFYERFYGNKPFIKNDGRSIKILGSYPKIHSGRIEVFDVQAEISFAIVRQSDVNSVVPVGAHLEAVPLGSIGHLLGDIPSKTIHVLGSTDLEARVAELSEFEKEPFAIVFVVAGADKVLSDYGTAYFNNLLASMYEAIRNKMPRAAVIGQIQATQIAVVGPNEAKPTLELIQEIISDIEGARMGIIQLRAGMFSGSAATKFESEQELKTLRSKKIPREAALELARYAALRAEFPETSDRKIFEFDRVIVNEILFKSRESENFEQFIIDYNKFSNLNAIDANCENQFALVYYQRRDFDRADEIYTKLYEDIDGIALRESILRNHVVVKAARNEFADAYEIYMKLSVAFRQSMVQPYLSHFAGMLVNLIEGNREIVEKRMNVPDAIAFLERFLSVEDSGVSANLRRRVEESLRLLKDKVP